MRYDFSKSLLKDIFQNFNFEGRKVYKYSADAMISYLSNTKGGLNDFPNYFPKKSAFKST